MATSYKKLWHILIDRKMKKKDLQELAGLKHYQMTKLAREEDITIYEYTLEKKYIKFYKYPPRDT